MDEMAGAPGPLSNLPKIRPATGRTLADNTPSPHGAELSRHHQPASYLKQSVDTKAKTMIRM